MACPCPKGRLLVAIDKERPVTAISVAAAAEPTLPQTASRPSIAIDEERPLAIFPCPAPMPGEIRYETGVMRWQKVVGKCVRW